MLLQPWITREKVRGMILKNDVNSLDINRKAKKKLLDCIDQYLFCGRNMFWREDEIPDLQRILKAVLGISDTEFEKLLVEGCPDDLKELVRRKTKDLTDEEIKEVCNVMTKGGGEAHE